MLAVALALAVPLAAPATAKVAAPSDELQGQAWVQHQLTEVGSVLRAGLVVIAITAIGAAYWRTRSLVPMLTTALLAGGLLWMADNPGWFSDRVADEHGELDTGEGSTQGQGAMDQRCMSTPPEGIEFGEIWWCGDWRCQLFEGTTHPGCQLVER